MWLGAGNIGSKKNITTYRLTQRHEESTLPLAWDMYCVEMNWGVWLPMLSHTLSFYHVVRCQMGPRSKLLTFEGCTYFRQRLVLSTLSSRPVRIARVRGDADEPGLRGLSIYTEGSLPTKFTTQGFIQLGETVRVSGWG